MFKMTLIVLSLSLSLYLKAENPVYFVDLQEALLKVNEGIQAQKTLANKFNPQKDKITQMENKLKKLKEDFDKKSAMLSPEQKQKEAQNLQGEFMQYQQFAQQLQMEVANMEKDLTAPIIKKLQIEIAEYGEKNKAFVLERNAVLSAPLGSDITYAIISQYNAKNKVEVKK